jgi:hypothetical protein
VLTANRDYGKVERNMLDRNRATSLAFSVRLRTKATMWLGEEGQRTSLQYPTTSGALAGLSGRCCR